MKLFHTGNIKVTGLKEKGRTLTRPEMILVI